jgi:hypothetical protein
VCWAQSAEAAGRTVRETWPNAAIPGPLSQDLPTWTHFEQATEIVTEDDATRHVPCGPDIVDDVVQSVREYIDAGYDHLYFHQIGDDQAGFFRFWEDELRGALRSMHSSQTAEVKGEVTVLDETPCRGQEQQRGGSVFRGDPRSTRSARSRPVHESNATGPAGRSDDSR